jgi:hypothetical protein
MSEKGIGDGEEKEGRETVLCFVWVGLESSKAAIY